MKTDTSSSVERLIDACVDDGRMLEHESRAVRASRREVLRELASERARFAADLEALVGGPGRRGRTNRSSWLELGRELGRSLRGVLGGPSEGDSVAACLRSCRRTESRYDAALVEELPAGVRDVVAAQRKRLGEDHDALVAIQF